MFWERCALASSARTCRVIGNLLLTNPRQHRTLHIQKDALPYALCESLCSVSRGARVVCAHLHAGTQVFAHGLLCFTHVLKPLQRDFLVK